MTPQTRGFVDSALMFAGIVLGAFGIAGLANDNTPRGLYAGLLGVGVFLLGAGITDMVVFIRTLLRRARSAPHTVATQEPIVPADFPVIVRAKKQGRVELAIVIYWTALSTLGAVALFAGGTVEPGFLFVGLMVLFPFLYWRRGGLSSVAEADRLVVRNFLRSRIIPRGDIEGFRIDRPSRRDLLKGSPSGRAVYLVLRDGSRVRIDATAPLVSDHSIQEALAILEGWRIATDRPIA